MDRLKIITRLFGESFKDLLPIILVIAFFQIFILQQVPKDLFSILLGLFIVAVGLTIFIQGLELGIFPVGEGLAHEFAAKGSIIWLLIFAFAIGFSTTVAEPALIAIAKKAELISAGRIDSNTLRLTAAFSVGFAIALGFMAYHRRSSYPSVHYHRLSHCCDLYLL